MKTSLVFRRAIQAILPATLLLAACSKSDTPTPTPAADTGKIVFINAASHVAPTTLKFLIDNSEKASLAYGASSGGYQTIQTGARPLQVTASGQVAFTQSLALDKDKNYTFVAAPAQSSSVVGGLIFPDDLTITDATKARIRVINLGQSVTNPIRLSQITTTVNGPVVADVVSNVGASVASPFVNVTANTYSLSILDANGTTIAQVGDGTGAGTGTKNYEAGKSYTVLVSGTNGSLNNDQKLKAFVLQNN
ncbi:DUF4397 domain-containing protein [Hymenobacter siberiensis]|uniref:DUF4397 domain-containing protein n=1 Tax=Hymenobacter siberiensis TaxID=2848396 RepID=UPI001C1E57EB|nr:DUF4397 domain-containing protein [Hymenobacter siberiensis]